MDDTHRNNSEMKQKMMEIIPLHGIPLAKYDDDILKIIKEALSENKLSLQKSDVLVIAHTIVSIIEGSIAKICDITLSDKAREIAGRNNADPYQVELALQNTEIVRHYPVLITRNEFGLITDYSGVDTSNAPPGCFVLLPSNPDRSAREIHSGLLEHYGIHVPVIISDTQGRPWRQGAVNLAVGIAGMSPFIKYAGKEDLYGNIMHSSMVCLADELAAAAELVMGQADEGIPIVLIRGVEYEYSIIDSASVINRPFEENLFP